MNYDSLTMNSLDDSWELKVTKDTKQHNSPTIAPKYSLEVLFGDSDNIPTTMLSSKLT